MNRNIDEDVKELSIYTYKDGKGKIPSGWKSIYTKENTKNGFYGEAFSKDGEIVIIYCGTDTQKGLKEFAKDLLKGDSPMGINLKSGQQYDAIKFYEEINLNNKNKRIVLGGHSLGGSLSQIVSAVSGRKAITFNAYGTGDILSDMGYKNQRLLDITNYGNPKDKIFQTNIKKQPGVIFMTNTNLNPSFEYVQKLERKLHITNLSEHNLENMDKLENSIKVSQKGKSTEKEVLKGSISYDAYTQKADILEELKLPQEKRIEKIKNMIFKTKISIKEFDEKEDHSSYINEVTKTNKIYTQEDIEKMSEEELKENQKAIDYQKKTMGVPSAKQAKTSGMVFVNGYTRSDGTEVKSYYRARKG